MDPLRIKEETKNYTVEKMDASYNEICKGVMDNDPASRQRQGKTRTKSG